jgi:hypothetical protein
MTKCASGKRIFQTRSLAEDALIDSWIRNNHCVGNGPVDVYQCDDCGNFHFTSKGAMNARLKIELDNGELAKQRRAYDLESKLKRR